MLLFWHIGLTLGIFFVIGKILRKDIDYRYVLLGSILPDLIDKPIGAVILKDYFSNGRIFSHTLAFVTLLSLFAILNGKMIILSFCSFLHLLEDSMWNCKKNTSLAIEWF
ncbi:MAG: metal-dependent hydrolase [Methanophagales archaeon]|nr:metal-dependent hydrolase [Methanophagales archaeon]